MSEMKSICVFCGSNPGHNPIYKETAIELAKEIVQKKYQLVYGGGKLGLMGTIANHVLDCGGNVLGVIPKTLSSEQLLRLQGDHLVLTDSISDRIQYMVDSSDALVVLPGGFGTMEELSSVLCWSELSLHQKPIILLNINGYFDQYISFLQTAVEEGFLVEANYRLLKTVSTIEEGFRAIDGYHHDVAFKHLSN